MKLKEFNNLTDLFFYQAEKQNQEDIFKAIIYLIIVFLKKKMKL